MKIQDAIAEVIYKKVRANPKKFHPALVNMAEVVSDYAHTYLNQDQRHRESPSWKRFKEQIEKHGCTENGQDARKD